jgi:hypothetical protein
MGVAGLADMLRGVEELLLPLLGLDAEDELRVEHACTVREDADSNGPDLQIK